MWTRGTAQGTRGTTQGARISFKLRYRLGVLHRVLGVLHRVLGSAPTSDLALSDAEEGRNRQGPHRKDSRSAHRGHHNCHFAHPRACAATSPTAGRQSGRRCSSARGALHRRPLLPPFPAQSPEVLIYVDMAKAVDDGLVFNERPGAGEQVRARGGAGQGGSVCEWGRHRPPQPAVAAAIYHSSSTIHRRARLALAGLGARGWADPSV